MTKNEPTNVERIKIVKAEVTAGDKSTAVAEDHYKTAGEHLHHLKSTGAHKDLGMTWADYTKKECGLSQERADFYIRLYKGSASLAKERQTNAARMRDSRKPVARATDSARTRIEGKTKAKKNELEEAQVSAAENSVLGDPELTPAQKIEARKLAEEFLANIPTDDIERDRQECIALNQKAVEAEKEMAQWLNDHPPHTEAEFAALEARLAEAEARLAEADRERDVGGLPLDDLFALVAKRIASEVKSLKEANAMMKRLQDCINRTLTEAAASWADRAVRVKKDKLGEVRQGIEGALNRALGEPASDDLELPECLRRVH